jgi:lysophospholipase L1-like esterase
MRYHDGMTKYLLVCLLLLPLVGRAATCLVHPGDRWVCLGDSITAEDAYRRMLGRVFAHFHPDAALTVINSGQAGDTASDNPQKLTDRVLKYNPQVVSVMYGMNEAINAWHRGQPKGPVQARYRQGLTYIARTCKAQGITVLLMSPTLTDPGVGWSFFLLEDTVPFLQECARIVREVAETEGVYYVPVQEEFEALQAAQPAGVIFRNDGVHVSAVGQYRMAQTLWERAGFANPLGAGRALSTPPAPAPVTVALTSRFLAPDAATLPLTFSTTAPVTATLRWSLGDKHGEETRDLPAGTTSWAVPVAGLLPARNGQNTDLLVDVRVGDADSLYIIDLCRTRVLHFVDDVAEGTVDGPANRPEGARIATWRLQRVENGLLFSGEVWDTEINSNYAWPFGKDGFNLMFDFRPTARFAGIGVDREVHQTLLNVREKPFFSVGLRAWSGEGMGAAGNAAGEKTATGYTTRLLIADKFNLHTPVDLARRDFVGLLVAVNDLDTRPDGKGTALAITAAQQNDYGVSLYANNLAILDLKNKLAGDAVVNVHLYGGR